MFYLVCYLSTDRGLGWQSGLPKALGLSLLKGRLRCVARHLSILKLTLLVLTIVIALLIDPLLESNLVQSTIRGSLVFLSPFLKSSGIMFAVMTIRRNPVPLSTVPLIPAPSPTLMFKRLSLPTQQ